MMIEQHVFLSTALLPHIWRNTHHVRCCGKECSEPATYVLMRLFSGKRDPDRLIGLTSSGTSAWCAVHLEKARKRWKTVPLIDQFEAAAAICDALTVEDNQAEQAARERHIAADRETMAEHGRVIRGSGNAGTLYERSDGQWEIQLGHRAIPEIVCCRTHGFYLVDNRYRGHAAFSPTEHSSDCKRNAAR